MKTYVSVTEIQRTKQPGKAAKDGQRAVAPVVDTLAPGTVFQPSSAEEEAFLLKAGAIRAYDPDEKVLVSASQVKQPEDDAKAKPASAKTAGKKGGKKDEGDGSGDENDAV